MTKATTHKSIVNHQRRFALMRRARRSMTTTMVKATTITQYNKVMAAPRFLKQKPFEKGLDAFFSGFQKGLSN
ncbi:hypothetical protein LHA01_07360 [Schleiferilactobacillus harbinensis]|nr:hypothetical protein LHA01_07360 [Schleiferilactobacillus harbinensis]